MLEAIDASYVVGYVEAIFRSAANPTKRAVKVFKKFGKKAAKHWFKHVTSHDLQNVEVYDFVRDRLALGFRSRLRDFSANIDLYKNTEAFIAYGIPSKGFIKVWG